MMMSNRKIVGCIEYICSLRLGLDCRSDIEIGNAMWELPDLIACCLLILKVILKNENKRWIKDILPDEGYIWQFFIYKKIKIIYSVVCIRSKRIL